MPKFLILRPFSSDRPHTAGDEVELNGPNLEKLVSTRYIQLCDGESMPKRILTPRQAERLAPAAKPAKKARKAPKKAAKPRKAARKAAPTPAVEKAAEPVSVPAEAKD
jgi:hypothetical protein